MNSSLITVPSQPSTSSSYNCLLYHLARQDIYSRLILLRLRTIAFTLCSSQPTSWVLLQSTRTARTARPVLFTWRKFLPPPLIDHLSTSKNWTVSSKLSLASTHGSSLLPLVLAVSFSVRTLLSKYRKSFTNSEIGYDTGIISAVLVYLNEDLGKTLN